MKQIKNQVVQDFLDDVSLISEDYFLMVSEIRKLFFANQAELSEGIKYGGLVFYSQDELIAGIWVYKKHISIEMSRGAELVDDKGILEGKGKLRRHIKLVNMDDIAQKEVNQFIKAVCQR